MTRPAEARREAPPPDEGGLAPMPLAALDRETPLALGLKPIEPADWFQFDAAALAYRAEKRALLDGRDRAQVLQYLEQGKAAARAALAAIAAHLADRHAGRFDRPGPGRLICRATGEVFALDDPARHPLETASLLVQEDLVLMAPPAQREGPYILESASVCFPTRWNLPSKLGRPMARIHDPVPGLNAAIGDKIDLFFKRMVPGRLTERANWSVLDSDALYQPTRLDAGDAHLQTKAEVARAGPLVLRMERQTLTKLDSGRILFAIRIHQRPLAVYRGRPDIRARLKRAVAGLPADLAAFKAVDAIRDRLDAELADQASAPSSPT